MAVVSSKGHVAEEVFNSVVNRGKANGEEVVHCIRVQCTVRYWEERERHASSAKTIDPWATGREAVAQNEHNSRDQTGQCTSLTGKTEYIENSKDPRKRCVARGD